MSICFIFLNSFFGFFFIVVTCTLVYNFRSFIIFIFDLFLYSALLYLSHLYLAVIYLLNFLVMIGVVY